VINGDCVVWVTYPVFGEPPDVKLSLKRGAVNNEYSICR